jgi:hypothetical protein
MHCIKCSCTLNTTVCPLPDYHSQSSSLHQLTQNFIKQGPEMLCKHWIQYSMSQAESNFKLWMQIGSHKIEVFFSIRTSILNYFCKYWPDGGPVRPKLVANSNEMLCSCVGRSAFIVVLVSICNRWQAGRIGLLHISEYRTMDDISLKILVYTENVTTWKWQNMSQRCCAHHLVLGLCRGNWFITPFIMNLCSGWQCLVSFTSWPLYPKMKVFSSFNRKLSVPQIQGCGLW